MQNLDHAPLRYLIVSEQFHNNFLFMIDIFFTYLAKSVLIPVVHLK